jgi:G:T-mismatch repair DNA endonuclease (very short patch repair protein)
MPRAPKAPKKQVIRRVRTPKVGRPRVSAKVIRKANRSRPASGFEKAIHAILKEEKIAFTKEKTIGRCHADIFIEPKTVIEAQGCFWHGHTCQKAFNKMQLEAHSKDARRFAFFQRLGFKVYSIWECELEQDPEKVREKLKKIAAAA